MKVLIMTLVGLLGLVGCNDVPEAEDTPEVTPTVTPVTEVTLLPEVTPTITPVPYVPPNNGELKYGEVAWVISDEGWQYQDWYEDGITNSTLQYCDALMKPPLWESTAEITGCGVYDGSYELTMYSTYYDDYTKLIAWVFCGYYGTQGEFIAGTGVPCRPTW